MMETSIEWGITPFALLNLCDMERGMMIAHLRERRMRASHVAHVQNKVMDAKSKQKPGGPSEHDRFFGSG